MYNPYLAFSCLQAQAFPTYNSSPFLANPINPLLLAASNSLNQKRPFLYDQANNLNESDFTPLASQKRFKADNNYGNLLENTQLQRLNPINEQRTKSTILNQQQVITIDDDEPAENSLTNSSSLTETMFSQRQNFNPMALLDFQKCFGINQYPPNALSLLLLNQLNQAQTQPFSQAFGYQDWNPSEIDRSSKFESVAGQTNLFEPLPANLKSVQKPSKLSEIVTIEDEEEDQSTCQTSQTERDVFSPCFSNSQIQNKASINAASTETAVVEEKTNTVPCYVKLPPFEMSVLNSQKKKRRVFKQVWNPKNIEAEKLEKWMDQISQAVGIEVTHEEKILKTMMGFGMNIESALEKIKRNKAYYKNYFRIKNAGRNY